MTEFKNHHPEGNYASRQAEGGKKGSGTSSERNHKKDTEKTSRMGDTAPARHVSHSRKRKYHFYIIMTRMFLGAAAVILILNLLVPSRTFSADENRNLAQRPKLTASALASGDFFKDFNSYISDQFVGRDVWMNIRSLGVALLGNQESGNVFFGKDGYLMAKPVVPDTGAVDGTVQAVNDFAGRHKDLQISMLLVPDAASILTDKLPANAPAGDQITDIRNFENRMDSSIHSIDAVSALQKNKEQKIFYRTDHHWTSLGAYEVFLGGAGILGIDSPITDNKVYTVTNSFQGTLASRSGRHIAHDSIEIYQPQGTDVEYYVNYPDTGEKSASMFDSGKLKEKDQYQVFFGGNHPLVEIHTTANNGRNLLVFKDSYANSFMQFLYPYFQNIIMIDPRYYYDDVETALTSYGITDVLFLYSADTLFADTNLTDTLNVETVQTTDSSSAAQGGITGEESVTATSSSSDSISSVPAASSSGTVIASSADEMVSGTSVAG
ncbi:MAG: DHHW family protein [Bilifractor sp.]